VAGSPITKLMSYLLENLIEHKGLKIQAINFQVISFLPPDRRFCTSMLVDRKRDFYMKKYYKGWKKKRKVCLFLDFIKQYKMSFFQVDDAAI
jgi:hypothetical protein